MYSYHSLTQHFRERNADVFPTPDLLRSFMFLTTEVGELGDAIARQTGSELRGSQSTHEIRDEIGDVFFMLITIGELAGVNVNDAFWHTLEKLEMRCEQRRTAAKNRARDIDAIVSGECGICVPSSRVVEDAPKDYTGGSVGKGDNE